jgi:hypothetical protein
MQMNVIINGEFLKKSVNFSIHDGQPPYVCLGSIRSIGSKTVESFNF